MALARSLFALGACLAISCAESDQGARPGLASWDVYRAQARPALEGGLISEWDLWFPDEEALFEHYQSNVDQIREKAHVWTQRSTGNWLTWPRQRAIDIKYCVDQATFGANYARAVSEMKQATQAWQDVANVRFKHLVAEDSTCATSNPDVDIAVSVPNNIGCASPPMFAWDGTAPLVGPCFQGPKFLGVNFSIADNPQSLPKTSLGVFRHELGHALGFRHEHAFALEHVSLEGSYGCGERVVSTDSDWSGAPLVDAYDAESVMHYPSPSCAGGPSHDYILSMKDGRSARVLYGPPVSWYVATGVL